LLLAQSASWLTGFLCRDRTPLLRTTPTADGAIALILVVDLESAARRSELDCVSIAELVRDRDLRGASRRLKDSN
jgi:hypothetical protein